MNAKFTSLYKITFLSLFLMASLGQFQRIQLTGQVAGYLHEILLGLFLILNAVLFFKLKLLKNITSRIDLPTAALFCYVTVQTFVYQLLSPNIVPLLYMVRLGAYLLFPVALLIGVRKKLITIRELYFTLLAFGSTITSFGLVQYVFFPDTRFLFFLGWDDHFFRLISTLFDPGFTGIIIVMTALLFLSQHIHKLPQNYYRNWLVLSVLLVSLLLTYSRASYLALGAGLLMLSFMSKKIIPVLFIIPVVIAIFFLPRPGGEGVKLERVFSAQSRLTTSMETLQQLTPLEFIVGQGSYRELRPSTNGLVNTAKTTDNSVLFLLTSMGVVGIILLLWWSYTHRQLFLNPIFLSIFSAVFIHSMFNNTLFYNFSLLMLGGVWALSQSKVKASMA